MCALIGLSGCSFADGMCALVCLDDGMWLCVVYMRERKEDTYRNTLRFVSISKA